MFNITEFQNYIRLVVDEKLEKSWPVIWYRCVTKAIPAGLIRPVSVQTDEGSYKEVNMRHYLDNSTSQHVYEVPLARNLVEDEIENVVWLWDKVYNQEHGDFLIETSTPWLGQDEECETCKDDKEINNIKEDLLREKHNRWMERMVDDGWKYGLKFSSYDKTHPLLRPWDELPNEQKDHPTTIW